jgi:hypothetical protein
MLPNKARSPSGFSLLIQSDLALIVSEEVSISDQSSSYSSFSLGPVSASVPSSI